MEECATRQLRSMGQAQEAALVPFSSPPRRHKKGWQARAARTEAVHRRRSEIARRADGLMHSAGADSQQLISRWNHLIELHLKEKGGLKKRVATQDGDLGLESFWVNRTARNGGSACLSCSTSNRNFYRVGD